MVQRVIVGRPWSCSDDVIASSAPVLPEENPLGHWNGRTVRTVIPRIRLYSEVMNTGPELADTLTSIESIRTYLAGAIGAASQARSGAPVRLTFIGGEFRKAVGAPFEEHLNRLADEKLVSLPRSSRKLATFVKVHCSDLIALDEDAGGIHFVSPAAAEQHGRQPLPEPVQTTASLRFNRAVWAAFIRPLEGRRRFLNLDKIGFTDAAEPPPGEGWREIEARFVLGLPARAPVDGIRLQRNIEDWATHAGVPVSTLVLEQKTPTRKRTRLDHLLELIDLLPTSVAATWSIPASVLIHLNDRD